MWMFIGLLAGIVLGLVPGLHINQIAPFFDGNASAVIIVSAAIAANFFEFIKASVFSMPGDGEVLAMGPLQRLNADGKMLYGLKLLSLGALSGSLLCCLMYPALIRLIPWVYSRIRDYVIFILLGVSIHLILRDRFPKKALFYFFAAGLVGLLAFNINMKSPLLPLLSGIFGVSSILFMKKSNVKQMELVAVTLERKELIKGSLLGFFSSMLLSFIPSIGPSQASMIGLEFDKKQNHDVFLVSLGSINTGDIFMSLISLYTLGKARLGAFSFINITKQGLSYLFLVGLFSSIASYLLMNLSFKRLMRLFNRIDTQKLKYAAIALVAGLCIATDGVIGLAVLALATIVGAYAEKSMLVKSHGMGCLIIPTLIYFLA